MSKKPGNDHQAWTAQDLKQLRGLAKQNTPTRVMGIKMDRTPGAIYAKASEIGLSLRPTNQSPYNRRKK
jgi:hypothetical protein